MSRPIPYVRRYAARFAVALWLIAAPGCALLNPGPPPGGYPNPIVLPSCDRNYLWDQVVDVVDNYFQIDREDRVRLEGDVLTVGRLDAHPQTSATLFEPFRRDSVGFYEKLESTLQSMRRRAVVTVEPTSAGYRIEVTVYEELEDVPRPENAVAGTAIARHDTSNKHFVAPVGGQPTSAGWIPRGRDVALEQAILGELVVRLGKPPPGEL